MYNHNTHSNQVRKFIVDWNLKYPVDLWWRQNRGVGFGSSEHDRMDLFDIRAQYEEAKWLEAVRKQASDNKKKYKPGTGNWIDVTKRQQMSSTEIQETYDRMSDLDGMKTHDDGTITFE